MKSNKTTSNGFTKQMIRIGTRGSMLARWQADWTATQLRQRNVDVEIVVIQTSGDLVQNQAIANIGAQGVFTKEIQRALLDEKIDVAVHSLKDLPTEPIDGLKLVAVPKRESVRDAFVSLKAANLYELAQNARIGTGSLRRKTQLLHRFGKRFQIDDIRGNVETRLRKLDSGEYDAVILAEAGLKRLGFADRIRSFLEPPRFLPAVGQGALGLETRTDDTQTQTVLAALNDAETFAAVLAERAMLLTLQGGCSAPIGAFSFVKDGVLTLHGRVLSLDGQEQFDEIQSISINETINPSVLGEQVAKVLLKQM